MGTAAKISMTVLSADVLMEGHVMMSLMGSHAVVLLNGQALLAVKVGIVYQLYILAVNVFYLIIVSVVIDINLTPLLISNVLFVGSHIFKGDVIPL